jgi:hypothetical protein
MPHTLSVIWHVDLDSGSENDDEECIVENINTALETDDEELDDDVEPEDNPVPPINFPLLSKGCSDMTLESGLNADPAKASLKSKMKFGRYILQYASDAFIISSS